MCGDIYITPYSPAITCSLENNALNSVLDSIQLQPQHVISQDLVLNIVDTQSGNAPKATAQTLQTLSELQMQSKFSWILLPRPG